MLPARKCIKVTIDDIEFASAYEAKIYLVTFLHYTWKEAEEQIKYVK